MNPLKKPNIPGYPYSEDEMASLLGEHPQTRARKRRRGIGPKPVRHGRWYLYPELTEYSAELRAAAERTERTRARQRHGAGAAGARA